MVFLLQTSKGLSSFMCFSLSVIGWLSVCPSVTIFCVYITVLTSHRSLLPIVGFWTTKAKATGQASDSLFAWLISHQPAVLFSPNKLAIINQLTVLFSQNKPAPAICLLSRCHGAHEME
jgi:hypothetical protein